MRDVNYRPNNFLPFRLGECVAIKLVSIKPTDQVFLLINAFSLMQIISGMIAFHWKAIAESCMSAYGHVTFPCYWKCVLKVENSRLNEIKPLNQRRNRWQYLAAESDQPQVLTTIQLMQRLLQRPRKRRYDSSAVYRAYVATVQLHGECLSAFACVNRRSQYGVTQTSLTIVCNTFEQALSNDDRLIINHKHADTLHLRQS